MNSRFRSYSFFISLFLTAALGLYALPVRPQQARPFKRQPSTAAFKWANEQLKRMSLDEKIGQLISERSAGALTYHTPSLYPTLYRLEGRGLIEGRWVERAGQRRRRYYKITAAGRRVLKQERSTWQNFFVAIDRIARIRHA